MRIGLYLENRNTPDADLRHPEQGNPGIGGTQFLFVCLPYYFGTHLPGRIEFVLLANHVDLLPPTITAVNADNCVDAARKARQAGCDIYVYRPHGKAAEVQLLDILDDLALNAVAWLHTTPGADHLKKLAGARRVKRVVFVGREQMDIVRDHAVFNKSTVIYNAIDAAPYRPSGHVQKDAGTVVFMSYPTRAFHRLARVWPLILSRVPHARLVVIGNSRLYDRKEALGEWGFAEEWYETQFIRPFLSGPDGLPHPSVSFVGLLGSEKVAILQRAVVGVVNPNGTECFSLSATEFQASGTPVVSGANLGLLDTVIHGQTGLLGKNDKDLLDNVTYLLRNPMVATQMGRNGIVSVETRFAWESICAQWSRLFTAVCAGHPNVPEPVVQNRAYRFKYAREAMRLVKSHVPIAQRIPALFEIEERVRRCCT